MYDYSVMEKCKAYNCPAMEGKAKKWLNIMGNAYWLELEPVSVISVLCLYVSIRLHMEIKVKVKKMICMCVCYLFLVVEVHLAVSHLPPQPVHFLAELQLVLPLVRRFIQLFGQVEVLAVQLGVLLTQLCELLLQVSDHLKQHILYYIIF